MGKKQKTTKVDKRKKETFFEKSYVYLGNIFSLLTLIIYLIGLPLYFKNGFNMVASTKYRYFVFMSVYVLGFYLIYLAGYYITYGSFKGRRATYEPLNKLDISMLSLLAAAFISHIFSSYKHVGGKSDNFFYEGSFFGINGWFMGFFTYFILVGLYFFISRFLKYSNYIWIPVVPATTLAFIWGSINRYGYFPFHISTWNPRLLAPIGNINWFASYASVMAPVIIGLYWGTEKKIIKGLLSIPVIFSYIQALVNGSDSGVFSFAITMFVLFVISLKKEKWFMRFAELFALFTLAVDFIFIFDRRHPKSYSGLFADFFITGIVPYVLLAITFILAILWVLIKAERIHFGPFIKRRLGKILIVSAIGLTVLLIVLISVNTKTNGSLPIIGKNSIFTYNDDWGSNRGATWKIGIMTFNRLPFFKKIIGAGPDMFYFALFDMDEVRDYVSFVFPGQRLTNAHNEIITMLVNMGILGAASLIAVIGLAFKEAINRVDKNPVFIVFVLTVVMYVANNMFGFEQIIGTTIFFVIISIEAAVLVQDIQNDRNTSAML